MLALFHPSLATEHLDCLHLLISSHPILLHVISCHLVSFHRKLFLNPAPGYDPYSDPLSIEGCSRPSATSCVALADSESVTYVDAESESDSDTQSESDGCRPDEDDTSKALLLTTSPSESHQGQEDTAQENTDGWVMISNYKDAESKGEVKEGSSEWVSISKATLWLLGSG
jgi:hypothetical protein